VSDAAVPGLVPPGTLGTLGRQALLEALSPLWEDAGPLADALVGRFVETWDDAVEVAAAAIESMDDDARAALLASHPRMGTPPEALAQRSAHSWREQGGASATPEEVTSKLEELNGAYEARFGFPFVEWVAGRSKADIVPVLETRLRRDRSTELMAGTTALVAIARDRLARLRSTAP
jgi:2-oxo-4-hydroxy-4-carboxy--5-ureidoimidazoline (OHCU) decarboxylase